jgi:glycosyltransferase involved in cell wall biosynthesis
LSAHPLLQGRQIVILASVDWDSAWQRHQALAEQFAAAGAEVFFVENTGFRGLRLSDADRVFDRLGRLLSPAPGPKTAQGDIHVIPPGVLPPTASFFRALNSAHFIPSLVRQLRGRGLKPKPLALAYLPTATTLGILDAIAPEAVVYDCVDNFYGHPCPPSDLRETETELLRRCALVLTTSQFLYDALKDRHPRVLQAHHGVSENFFIPAAAGRSYNKLCYFGTVWSALDFTALKALAEAGFEVTLLGPVKEAPPLPPSVRFLPPLSHKDLPSALAEFDALLLPYADTPYNQGVIPAKTFECLATGRPVLAAPLPSLKALEGLLYLASTPEDYVRIARSLGESESQERVYARVKAAKEHTTGVQFGKILDALSQALGYKLYERPEN